MKYWYLGIALFCMACSKKDQPAPTPTGPVTQQEINNWMLDSMRLFYLWNETLPVSANPQQETVSFYNSLKNAADPFSMIYNPGNWATFPRSMLYNYGMDYSIIPHPSAASGFIGVVRLVIPGSNADKAGFSRGMYFTAINGQPVNSSNAATITAQLLREGKGNFTPATITAGVISEQTPVEVLLGIVTENPIYLQKVINSNGKKIGYLFYNAFNDNYNNALLTAFQDFKTQGVTELILDLRYNTGGSLAAAAVLSSLVASRLNAQTSFVEYTGNNKQGKQLLDVSTMLRYPESGTPVNFSSIQSARLTLDRVFILTGRQTISAAELTINNLKPYTQIIQIGQTTYGKDKGAVIIKDGSRRITWVLQPIAYRLSNAKGEGNYATGITPQYVVDEMTSLPLSAIGDISDPLITRALALINGGGRSASSENVNRENTYFNTLSTGAEVIIPR